MDIKIYLISETTSIKASAKNMDQGGIGFLVVINSVSEVLGVVSNGDLRRAIINGVQLSAPISSIMNRKYIYLPGDYVQDDVIRAFNHNKIQQIPVIVDKKLVDIITEEDAFNIRRPKVYKNISLPVVIMAGGKGSRLEPFTRILPKPLIPIGDRTIIEVIMAEFAYYGMQDMYISINHKGNMIKAYFEELSSDYSINFITENKPLGTAGALKLMSGLFTTPFFVSNCDIIIREDYSKIYDFHKSGEYAITLVASMRNYTIPYGVCEIENGGLLKQLKEKPEYDFLVNTGLYIINPEVLGLISENQELHMTELIQRVQDAGKRVGVFPVMSKAWIDIGQWEEYKRNISLLTN